MERLELREYEPKSNVRLTQAQVDQLRTLCSSLAIVPAIGGPGLYDLTPGADVGAIHVDELDIVIRSKVAHLDRLLFILSFALGNVRWLESFKLDPAVDLPEAIVPGFVHHVRSALSAGVIHMYRSIDESSLTIRGRWRVSDQIRRRYGIAPPAEITYDDYTVDNELNRILLAATHRLLQLRLRSDRSRAGLRAIVAHLEGVSLVRYDLRRLPTFSFSRLTARYRPAVQLALLILSSTSFDLGHGAVPGTAFLVDMNKAFEDFLVAALRDELHLSDMELVQGSRGHPLFLDEEGEVKLKPDLSIWRGGEPTFVGDAKYKRLVSADNSNADIYQAMAYATATGLDSALLIYAAGEGEPGFHTIVNIGKRIEIISLDLTGTPDKILDGVHVVGERIRANLRPDRFVAA